MMIQKQLGPRRVSFVPLELFPPERLPARSWELRPGLFLQRLAGKTKKDLTSVEAKITPTSSLCPNYVVKIDSIAYGSHVRSQLLREGKELPSIPDDIDIIGIDSINLSKMILLSLFFQNNYRFALSNVHSFEISNSGEYNLYNKSVIIPNKKEEIDRITFTLFPSRPQRDINKKLLVDTISHIEQYYRPIIWEVDRVSVALSYLWSALTSRDLKQIFTNLSVLIECLLSTSSTEATHLISERAATILGKDGERKIDIYRKVKQIYNQRSKIVHGKGVPKKGPIDSETFIVSTKLSKVPRNILEEALRISLDLLASLIRNNEYMSIVRSGKSEEKIDQQLDKFFLERLLA